jgi:hypothetical protein
MDYSVTFITGRKTKQVGNVLFVIKDQKWNFGQKWGDVDTRSVK